MLSGTELAVWGDPIDHSLSPRLHAAAYGVLRLDWTYGRRRVDEAGFVPAVAGLGQAWRGLSLTMPLKTVAARTAATSDRHTVMTGAANTFVLDSAGPRAFNTDVPGLRRALAELGLGDARTARILGSGATATSAVVALADLGAPRVQVHARRPEAAAHLLTLGGELDVVVEVAPLDDRAALSSVDVTIATLPGGTDLGPAAARFAEHGGTLFDVVYGGWPTPLAHAWWDAGHDAHAGIGMLVHQALLQVRAFVSGDVDAELDGEDAVLAAMRSAVVGD